MGKTSGTKEWASTNVNCYFGCSNDCSYCYAKRMGIRFERNTEENWKEMKPNWKAINKQYKKREGRIMFPTSHDITKESINNCIIVLKKLLKAGNEVLITTKPNENLMYNLMEELSLWKKQILFRFTITSVSDAILSKYEPGAPDYESRYMSVWNAHENGWKTSISIEPFLDKDPIYLITRFFKENERSYTIITDTVWLGIMSGTVPEELKPNYAYENVKTIVENIKKLPAEIKDKIRLKDSIKNMELSI